MLMGGAPQIGFFEDEDDCAAYYCDGSISINNHKWHSRDIFGKLFVLGHEFIHWLQEKAGTNSGAYEEEADKLGNELARKEIIRGHQRRKFPVQLELPLDSEVEFDR